MTLALALALNLGYGQSWCWGRKWRATIWQKAAMILFNLINMTGMAEPACYKG